MSTTERDFDSGIEEKQREDHVAKNAPERPPPLYGRQGRVMPDPETNPARRCRRGMSSRLRLFFSEHIRAVDPKHAFGFQLLTMAPSSLRIHYRNQSNSDSSRNSVTMLRHLRSAQRMMLRCWTVNSPSMIARFTMSSILSSVEQPELTS
ncbi:MAG: hypothetical protein WA197_06595 [Candidatus Acidiferrales bacterium]